MENKLIYLYLKISPKEGLRYLGKTIKDPFKYRGSGKYWVRHLKYHNIKTSELKTIVLFSSYYLDEIKEMGLYYSNIWNIVESDKFANLIPEAGEGTFGYKYTEERLQKAKNRIVSKKTREKIGNAHKGMKWGKETCLKIGQGHKGLKHTDATKSRLSIVNLGKKVSNETRIKLKERFKTEFIVLDLSGNYINTFSLVSDAIIALGIKSKVSILNVLKKKSKATKGYQFILKNEYDPINNYNLNQNGVFKKGKATKLLQYDLDGNFIKEFNSYDDALLSLGITKIGYGNSNIYHCCTGKFKQAYGYIWKYKNK